MQSSKVLSFFAAITFAVALPSAAFGQTSLASAPAPQATAYSSSLDNAVRSADFLNGDGTASGGGQYQSGYRGPKQPNAAWNHVTWEAGGGFTQPLAGARRTVNTAYRIQLGAGYNFVPRFGILAEYAFNRFGLTDAVINCAGTDDGNTHLWSTTLEPIFRYKNSGKFGGYVIGGGGFYRALTSFTNATTGIYCDPFYGCYPVQQNYVVSHFSSNQGGANLGLGFTYKTSADGRLALYTEARYEWVNTPGHYSEFVPVTLGLRF
jgi:hypothetical protein